MKHKALICSILALIVSSLSAADWPNWRGPNHNGITSEKIEKLTWGEAGPAELWEKQIGYGYSSLVVKDGKVYASGNKDDQDTVYCFEVAGGKELWRHSYQAERGAKYYEGGPNTTPAVADDGVYNLGKQGVMMKLDLASGKPLWEKDLRKELGLKLPEWFFGTSPIIYKEMVILNAGTAGVALKRADGSVAWSTGTETAGYATPVPAQIGGKEALVMFTAKAIVAVEPASGKELWKYHWKTSYDANIADPLVRGDEVFVSSGYGKGCTLIKVTDGQPEKVWENKNMRNHFNSSVLWEGHVYGFDENELRCVDWKNGEVKWSQKGLGKGSLILADGKLVILGERGKLAIAAANPEAYKELASAQVLNGQCWTAPVLAEGKIFARNSKGDLVCLDLH